MSERETDVQRMYPPILNCRYRNDKIFFDWTEYEPPIDIEQKIQRQRGENTFSIQELASI